jgi:hypothetical protein
LKYEITHTFLFRTKNGFFKKSVKGNLIQELIKELPQPISQDIPSIHISCTLIVDFMALARKNFVRKVKLKIFGELANCLWKNVLNMSPDVQRIDIVFENYNETNIKSQERIRRTKRDAIDVAMLNPLTPLPVEV